MSILHSLKKIWTSPEEGRQPKQAEQPAAPCPPEVRENQPAQPTPPPEPATEPAEPVQQAEPAEPYLAPVLLPESRAQVPYEPSIMEQRAAYTALTDKIIKVYNTLRGQSAFESPAIDELLLLCNQAISLRKKLLPSLSPSDWIYPHGEAYKRLAMALEKRGDYQGAAEICLMALRDGATNDGSQHGMAGRMSRMLKRAKTAPTPEMKQYLQKKQPKRAEKPLPRAAGGED